MPSPPKPWEVNNGAAASTPVVSQAVAEQHASDTVPSVPNRPTTTAAGVTSLGTAATTGSNLGGFGSTSYGNGLGSSYGTGYGTGGYGSYGSGYGGYGSGYGTGYGTGYGGYNRMGYGGGYGSSYGSYGMGGYNRFGMGGFGGGMYGGPEGPESLTQRMESSTRATFDVIYSIVGAFGGFAQMLDSTYMATHSSFMAMVGVAEQTGNLKHYLGNILGIFALIRWVKRLFYRITGRTPPPELLEEDKKEEEQQRQLQQGEQALQITENGEPVPASAEEQQQVAPVSRKRPIIIFLAIVTGLPYLMYKLIQRSNEIRTRQQRMMIPQYGGPPPELATVMHDFIGENPIELTIRRGDTIQVLSKVDPATGLPCEWWQGRLNNGVIGIFPANYVQIVN